MKKYIEIKKSLVKEKRTMVTTRGGRGRETEGQRKRETETKAALQKNRGNKE